MKVFAIYGTPCRDLEGIWRKEFLEVESFLEAIQISLEKIGYTEVDEDTIKEWFEEEREGVYSFNDDCGIFAYVGEDRDKVLEVYIDSLPF